MVTMDFFTVLKKGTEMQFDHESAYTWQEDAACRFLPWSMFEIASRDSKISEGMTEKEIKDLNATNFKAADKACGKCPVIADCYSSTEDGDHLYTFRAGIVPLNFNPTPQGRPSGATTGGGSLQLGRDCKKCSNDDWYSRGKEKNGKIRYNCRVCKNAARRESTERRQYVNPEEPCKNGHAASEWVKSEKSSWRCRGCIREDSRAYRAKVKAKKEAATIAV